MPTDVTRAASLDLGLSDSSDTSRSSGKAAHSRVSANPRRDEAYLNHADAIVLSLNPFFILEDDPTPTRGSQIVRLQSSSD